MLTVYYSRGCNSKEMFISLKIVDCKDFERYLNQFNVIHINMMDFFSLICKRKLCLRLSRNFLMLDIMMKQS